ncbi:bacitracin ABC transporter permease, partial [Staphylococcus aureus]|nr:bacitracin ABC transporter permease [Staphylococcus aureus]
MTFNHIVLKNLRQNLKHYAMYLFSLFFSIVLYFSFTTLQFTKGVNNDDSMAIIKKGALVGSIFLITGVVGVLCGIAGAQLLLSIVSKLMSLSINLSIHFEPMAL